nr:armadillo repeat-containing protein LFR [Ipomoea batatas]
MPDNEVIMALNIGTLLETPIYGLAVYVTEMRKLVTKSLETMVNLAHLHNFESLTFNQSLLSIDDGKTCCVLFRIADLLQAGHVAAQN